MFEKVLQIIKRWIKIKIGKRKLEIIKLIVGIYEVINLEIQVSAMVKHHLACTYLHGISIDIEEFNALEV